MSDIISLLPDSVANQIAAGEVIQRPASVVKELVENSIDAGAKNIQVIIKDGGSTLIRVVDDGIGMSETDARMSFERHATSKIKNAEDLFTLHTMGFRGEALASIAAVAQVEMRTRREEDELGTSIEIAGTRIFHQELVQCDKGTNISVKNLFFNVPARRRFLKSPSTETMHIRNEFYRIVLVHPDVHFSFFDGEIQIMDLPVASLKARIENVFDFSQKKINQQLLPIEANTGFVNIYGFIGRPEFAQKSGNQYFFVNGRYMRHPYFHKAVMTAYEKLIKPGENPNYFIYFEIDPHNIDVNVHPAKTEIKFENEQAIWSIILATLKESLGKFQVFPSIDFDKDDSPEIPVFDSKTAVNPPKINFNPAYNPFHPSTSKFPSMDWEKLYADFQGDKKNEESSLSNSNFQNQDDKLEQILDLNESSYDCFQYKSKYILTGVKSGLMIIDQHRAHFRVLYDNLMLIIRNQKGFSQQVLFPEILELDMEETERFERILPELQWVGFDIEKISTNTFSINGTPSEIQLSSSLPILQEVIDQLEETEITAKEIIQDKIAIILAKKSAIQYGQALTTAQMTQLLDDLFSCENHQYTPDGKPVFILFENDEIEKKFK